MPLAYVPLLGVQRELYALPRGPERFREYIRTMVDPDSDDLKVPLVAMNPMGKDHLPPFLDHLLSLDADGEGARATERAAVSLGGAADDYRVCLVVSDDLKGGWTNRHTSEFGYRFAQRALYKRGWIAALVWTSETYDRARVRAEVGQCIFRAAYVAGHGEASSLGQMLAQERYAIQSSGGVEGTLDAEDLDYTRAVLAAYMDRTDRATLIAALYGDGAARDLGYPPLGLSPRAGLALAASHDADLPAV